MATLDPRGLVPYIRATAAKYGINPDIAVKVAQSEGLGQFTSGYPGEDSFGAFQLNTQGGLGNDFQKATGLDPSDPANEQAGIDYALKYASQNGWNAFHGAKRVGLGQWAGIDPTAIVNQAPLTPGSPAPALPPGINIDGQQPTAVAGGVLPAAATTPQQKQQQAQGGVLGGYAAAQQQQPNLSLLNSLMAQANTPMQLPRVNLSQLQQMLAQRPPLGWNAQGWNGNGWNFG